MGSCCTNFIKLVVGAGLCSARLKITKNQSIKQKLCRCEKAPSVRELSAVRLTEGVLQPENQYKHDVYVKTLRPETPSVTASPCHLPRRGRLSLHRKSCKKLQIHGNLYSGRAEPCPYKPTFQVPAMQLPHLTSKAPSPLSPKKTFLQKAALTELLPN